MGSNLALNKNKEYFLLLQTYELSIIVFIIWNLLHNLKQNINLSSTLKIKLWKNYYQPSSL